MRLLLGIAGLALVALGPALAHEEDAHVGHMNIVVEDAAPGARNVHALSFDEMGTEMGPVPLRKGWLFALVIVPVNETAALRAAVVSEHGAEAANWTLVPARVNKLTALLPETDEYRVHVTNLGSETARYAFYFDQSCNCAGKPLPKELPGLLIFNVDGRAGDRLRANFPQPPAVTIKVTAATLADDRAMWPTDFRVLASSTEPRARQARDDLPPVSIHELDVTFEETGRIYFIVEPSGPNAFAGPIQSPEDVMVTPFYDHVEKGKSPAVGIAGALVVLGVVLILRRPS